MAEHPREAIAPMNATINDTMNQPIFVPPSKEIIEGSHVWEDMMDEIQAKQEAKSLESEDNGSVQPVDSAQDGHQDHEQVDD